MNWKILFILTLLTSSLSLSAESCIAKSLASSIKSEKRPSLKKFWAQDNEVTIRIKDKDYPLTYSFDSEFSYGDTLILLEKDPKYIEDLQQLFKNLRIEDNKKPGLFTRATQFLRGTKETREEIDLLNIPLERILEADRIMNGGKKARSAKQFFAFGGVRKGVPKDQDTYAITDLSPRLYDFFVSDIVDPILETKHQGKNLKFMSVSRDAAQDFTEGYRKLMQKVMVDDMGMPVKATLDAGYLEFPHSSYETIPSTWNRVLKEDINDQLKWSSSHMHIGIPAEIGKTKMDAIARAVEARIILEHAASSSFGKKLYATSYSTLRGNPDSAKKSAGVIRMNYKRHKEPFEMHDLEVRNYLKFEEGQNHLALAAAMAQDHNKIRLVDNMTAKKIEDPNTSNLNGALRYVGMIALENGNAPLGQQMIRLAKEIEDAGEITLDKRKEVQKLLKSSDIMKLLSSDFFLK